MFQKILVPLDGSELSEKALEYARHLGKEANSIVLLRARSTSAFASVGYNIPDEVFAAELETCTQYLQHIEAKLVAEGYQVILELPSGEPAEAILQVAEKDKVDLIVISSHGREGMTRFLVGSVAERVARHAPCPVMIVGRGASA